MTTAGPQPGQPVVFRNATVLTMDDSRTVLTGADVLTDGERIAAVGPNLAWSHGRTWLSAAYGIGIYHIRDAPKLNWGIAF